MKLFLNNVELDVEVINPIYITNIFEIHQMYSQNNWGDCEKLGEGDNSVVYGYKDYAIKVFKSNCYHANDFNILKELQDCPAYPTLYYGVKNDTYNYIVMERINGKSFFEDCVNINDEWYSKMKEFLYHALKQNVVPRDIHLNNVLIDGNQIRIIDVGNYYHWNFSELQDYDFMEIENILFNFQDYYDYMKKETSNIAV